MTKEEKIKRIYDVIADKTLSFGCLIEVTEMYEKPYKYKTKVVDSAGPKGEIYETIEDRTFNINDCSYEIIGHPVMIGDVLEWIRKNDVHIPDVNVDDDIEYQWKNGLNKPIDEQDDATIDFIYSLVKDD